MAKNCPKKPTIPRGLALSLSDCEVLLKTIDQFVENRIEELDDAVNKSGAAGARFVLESFVREANAALAEDVQRAIKKTHRRRMI